MEETKRLSVPCSSLTNATLRVRRWEDAVKHAREAVRIAPTSADDHYWLARALVAGISHAGWFQKAKLSVEAKAEFESALAINANHTGALYGMSRLSLFTRRFVGGSVAKARSYAQQLLAFSCGVFHGHRVLAMIAFKSKNWDASSAEWHAACDIASTPCVYLFYLAMASFCKANGQYGM